MTLPFVTLAFALCCGVVLWLVSLRLTDVSIIDIFWGPGIAAMVDIAAWMTPEQGERGVLALILVNAWGLRLALHIGLRHRGEDRRYATMRQKFGPRWWWWSFFQVFLLQIILIWLLPAPLQATLRPGPPLGLLDGIGAALAAGGLFFEAVADTQLARFQRDPVNKGRVLERGLWGLSRHPNYFGETLLWWGFFLIGFAASANWWLLLSPLAMTLLLLKVSGVSLMEEKMEDRRPGYAAYKREVSAFLPWFRTPSPPRR
jgi:steroid 5-alpha reductase family enzyme